MKGTDFSVLFCFTLVIFLYFYPGIIIFDAASFSSSLSGEAYRSKKISDDANKASP